MEEKGQSDNSHLLCCEPTGSYSIRWHGRAKRVWRADPGTGGCQLCSPPLTHSSPLAYRVLGCCLVVTRKSSCPPAVIGGCFSLQLQRYCPYQSLHSSTIHRFHSTEQGSVLATGEGLLTAAVFVTDSLIVTQVNFAWLFLGGRMS